MSAEGEVNLEIDVNISNVTDIAKEIAKQLNLGKEDTMPSGKSQTYQDTWLEVSLMKSIVKTMSTNYEDMLSSFETLNKKLQVNVGKELKDILSKGKDMKVDVQNIEALTDEFISSMSEFIKGFDFPQLQKGGEAIVRETIEPSIQQFAYDYSMESAVISALKSEIQLAYLDITSTLGEVMTLDQPLTEMKQKLETFHNISMDDIGKLIQEVMIRASANTQSRMEQMIRQQPANDVIFKTQGLMQKAVTDDQIKDWLFKGIPSYDVGDELTDNMTIILEATKTAMEMFSQLEGTDVREAMEKWAQALSIDVTDIKVADFSPANEARVRRSGVFNPEFMDDQITDLHKFIASSEFIAGLNLSTKSAGVGGGDYTTNEQLQNMINKLLTAKGGMFLGIPQLGKNVEKTVLQIIQSFENKIGLWEGKTLSSKIGGRQVDISLDQSERLKKIEGIGELAETSKEDMPKALAEILRQIDMVNFEVRSGGAGLRPSDLKKELERMLKDYSSQIAGASGLRGEELINLTKRIEGEFLDKTNSEMMGILSEKLRLIYATDTGTSMDWLQAELDTIATGLGLNLTHGKISKEEMGQIARDPATYTGGANIIEHPISQIGSLDEVATQAEQNRMVESLETLRQTIRDQEEVKKVQAMATLDEETKATLNAMQDTIVKLQTGIINLLNGSISTAGVR